MPKKVVDLASHLNRSVTRGHPAEFPVVLRPVFCQGTEGPREIETRRAIVREDTGEAIAVVSDRYTLVPHQRILDTVEEAIGPLDLGPVPRGIFVDGKGARMRALYKFPSLAQSVLGDDEICPCLQVRNTYDGSSRIALHIGAFRFVCTNLSVGGGGAFAGGFVSIHAGEIPIETMAGKLQSYLTRFDAIVAMYRQWSDMSPLTDDVEIILNHVLRGRFEDLRDAMLQNRPRTVFDAYNRLTHHATHSMRSARTAFDMLESVNVAFQDRFPVLNLPPREGEVVNPSEDAESAFLQ